MIVSMMGGWMERRARRTFVHMLERWDGLARERLVEVVEVLLQRHMMESQQVG